MSNRIKTNLSGDGVDRRGFLECMAWVGTGMVWSIDGGVLSSQTLGHDETLNRNAAFTFVQISDSHIGFNKQANNDVVGTLRQAIAKINALDHAPDFLIHTGDLTHLSKPSEFDTLRQVLQSAHVPQMFFVPGEHDMLVDDGRQYRELYGKNTEGAGWYSFDHKGVHFVGLVNVVNLKAGGLGALGDQQLQWLAKDLSGRTASTPIVVFAHIPLWTVYPEWGWGTDDGAQALSYLRRFGSVTVLNGHIHQTLQKTEGNLFFHTAMSTAFPQPKPGAAASPGPLQVSTGQLASVLGITSAQYVPGGHALAVVDRTLAASPNVSAASVKIDNFTFAPSPLAIEQGTAVTWTNHDDIPHNVESADHQFASSPILDTGQTYSFTFTQRGDFPYYCKIHPRMTGVISVRGPSQRT